MQNTISQQIESFAESIYLNDTTGENFIENVIHATNLPTMLGRLKDGALSQPILEMGFGEGTITTPLVQAGCTVEIVEGSEKLCQQATKQFGDAVKVHCSYFEKFTPAVPFQTVLSLHVLEHVDSPEAVVQQMRKWIRPGGQIIAVVPNAESLHRQLAVMMGLQPANNSLSPRDKLVGHQRVMTLDELAAVFTDAGFEVTERFGYFLKTVPNSMMTTYSPDLLKALTRITADVPPHLMANIGIVATAK